MPRSKLGSLRHRNGKWQSQIRDPRALDANGKAKTRSKTWPAGTTEKQANKRHAEWCADILGRRASTAERKTVAALLDEWLTDVEPDVAVATINAYRNNCRRATRHIGAIRLVDLDPRDIRHLIDQLHAEGASHRTASEIKTTVSQALNAAVEWGYLPRNPAATIRVRRTSRQKAAAQAVRDNAGRDKKVPTAAELDRIIAAEPSPVWRTFWIVHRALAARPSETLALHWQDINLPAKTVRIERTVTTADRSGTDKVGDTTKTGGARTVTIGLEAAQTLAEWRAELASINLLLVRDGMPVFPSPQRPGQPYARNHMHQQWRAACERAGVPDRTLHGFRHWAGSTLLQAGVGAQEVARRLGHTVPVLMGTYAGHLPAEADRDVSEYLERKADG